MDAELKERVLECLRGCDIGESMAADEMAESTGHQLSEVYDALEYLEKDKLVESPPTYGRGDPTYRLTPKGKRLVHIESIEPPEPEGDPESTCQYCGTVMASPARKRNHELVCGKNPNRNPGGSRKESAGKARGAADTKARKQTEEPLVECPDCHRMVNRVSMHKAMGGCRPPAGPAAEVPAPVDQAEAVSNATATLEHYQDPEPEIHEALEQLNAEDPDVPDEVPDYSPANNAADQDTLLAGFLERVRAQDALVLKGSPGMDAALRLISFCQQMAGSGAQVSVDATVQIASGFHIRVDLCVPTRDSDE